MKEIKSTIVGVFLILLGSFFFYSENIDTHCNDYILYSTLGIIIFGLYLLFTDKKNRKLHFETVFNLIVNRFKTNNDKNVPKKKKE